MTSALPPCTPGRHRPEAYVPLQASTPPATPTRIPSSPGVLRRGSNLSFSDRFRLSRITRNETYSSGLPFASRSTTSLLGTPSKRAFPGSGPKRQYSIGLGRTGSTSPYTPSRSPSSTILSRLSGLTAPSSLPARLRSAAAKGQTQNASSLSRETDWGDPWVAAVVEETRYPFEDSLEQTEPQLRSIQEHIRYVVEGDETNEISRDCKQAALGARVIRSIGPLDGWDDLVLRQALRSMVKTSEERARARHNAWSPSRVQKKQAPSSSSTISRLGQSDTTPSRRSSCSTNGVASRQIDIRTPARAYTLDSLHRKPVPKLPSPPHTLGDPESPTPATRRGQTDRYKAALAPTGGGRPARKTISPSTTPGLHRSAAIKAAAPVGRLSSRPKSSEIRATENHPTPFMQSTLSSAESDPIVENPHRPVARTPLGPTRRLPAASPSLSISSSQHFSPVKAPRASRMSTLVPTKWLDEDNGMTPKSPLTRPRPPFARGLNPADTAGKMLSSPSRPRWR